MGKINTNFFQYAESRWQDIVLHLKSCGFDVYPPGVKVGECLGEYIVVKNNGSSAHPSFSTDKDSYVIMCYVPKQKYSTLEPFVQRVKCCMRELEPLIRYDRLQTPSYYDDSFKAHMISLQYYNYKKI